MKKKYLVDPHGSMDQILITTDPEDNNQII
jgi:hypothetical protein